MPVLSHLKTLKLIWLFNLTLFSLEYLWLFLSNISLNPHDLRLTLIKLSFILIFILIFIILTRKNYINHPRKNFYYSYIKASYLLLWFSTLVVFIVLAVLFQYLGTTIHFPLATPILLSWDQHLGFYWPDIYKILSHNKTLREILRMAYNSMALQLIITPLLLLILGKLENYISFVIQFIISASVTVLISIFFPVESAFTYFKMGGADAMSSVADFHSLRNGTLHYIYLSKLQGLVSFPSFHAILAILIPYSLRQLNYIYLLSLVLNMLMLISTLSEGGHYLFDVIGGVITALIIIRTSQLLNFL